MNTTHEDALGCFDVPGHAAQRHFAIYVVVASPHKAGLTKIYVGKTGDNRDGCNPVISRFGNHVSFNLVHAQLRKPKNLGDDEVSRHDYRIFYAHFDPYNAMTKTPAPINVINEMEWELNHLARQRLAGRSSVKFLNSHSGKRHGSKSRRLEREGLVTPERQARLEALWARVEDYLQKHRASHSS